MHKPPYISACPARYCTALLTWRFVSSRGLFGAGVGGGGVCFWVGQEGVFGMGRGGHKSLCIQCLPIHVGTGLGEGIKPPKSCTCGVCSPTASALIRHSLASFGVRCCCCWCTKPALLGRMLTHAEGMPQHCLTSASHLLIGDAQQQA